MDQFDLNFRHLQAFVTVARLNSFTRAAKVLYVSQPALTKRIGQLEETMGIRLFDRNTRTVSLTQIGKELTPIISQLLREMEGVLFDAREVSAKNRGTVRVAAFPSLCSAVLPAAIARFRGIHSGISVILRDVVSERIVGLVKTEEVDFGIGTMLDVDADIQFAPLFSDRMVAGFPPDHPLAKHKSVSLSEVARYPLVLLVPGISVRTLVDGAFASIGTLVKPAYEATYMSTVAAMVKAGLGVTLLPSLAVAMGELSGLATCSITNPVIKRDLGILTKAGRSLSPAAESFIRTVRTVVDDMH